MLDLLLLPFTLAWELLCLVWDLVTGAFSLVFGLLGGLASLLVGVATICTVAALITLALRHRDEKKKSAPEDDFISYYDKDAVK